MAKLRPVGVVFSVDGKHYVKLLNAETTVIAPGQTLLLTLDDCQITNWQDNPEAMGLFPISSVEKGNPAPTPPKFGSVEEADAWLDSHPVRT